MLDVDEMFDCVLCSFKEPLSAWFFTYWGRVIFPSCGKGEEIEECVEFLETVLGIMDGMDGIGCEGSRAGEGSRELSRLGGFMLRRLFRCGASWLGTLGREGGAIKLPAFGTIASSLHRLH